MEDGIFSAIGNTPLVRLNKIFKNSQINLYAKLEFLNPGGSAKDRPAYEMINDAIKSGLINKNTTIVESSSGNMAIALSQVCAYYGLRFICVVDSKTTDQNLKIIKAYGTNVIKIEVPDNKTGEYLGARIDMVKKTISENDNCFWPNQYANESNPKAYHRAMYEIDKKLHGKIDYLFCATSTCGTIRGLSEYIKSRNLSTKIIAVDAFGSVIFSGERAKRLIPGHGASIRPKLFKHDMVDDYEIVTDYDCVWGCRKLVATEGILVGGSAGGVISAINKRLRDITPGSNLVAIFHDKGDRYLDTIYSDEWINNNFDKSLVSTIL